MDVATAQTAPEGQAPAQAPSQTPALTVVPGGDGQSQQGQPAQAPAAPAPPAAPQSAPDEPHVPWGRFREVQTQFSQMRRAAQQAQEKYEQQIAQHQKELEELRTYRDDFTTLERLLEANPQLAEQLYQQAGQNPLNRGVSPTQPAVPAEVVAALKDVQELKQLIAGERQKEMLRQQAEQDRQVSTQLDNDLRRYLTEAGMDEGWLPHARGYVLERVRAMPTLDIQDVPYLFAEWRKPMQSLVHRQVESWRSGKAQDQQLPASPAPTPPISGRPNFGANDRTTMDAMLEELQRRGWTG